MNDDETLELLVDAISLLLPAVALLIMEKEPTAAEKMIAISDDLDRNLRGAELPS